jgi:Uma2 family endonuclease
MSQVQRKPEALAAYPYHLPDKPLPTGSYISYDKFLEWADEDTLAEWVDGRIEMSSPANWKHQQLVSFFNQVVGIFAKIYQQGEVALPPFQMKLSGKRGSGREPDLVFVAKPNLSRLESGLVRGPADLVIEVTSPESAWRDRHDKFYEYAAGGVPEYWIIDPDQQQAEFYRLTDDGQYQAQPLDLQGRYYSPGLPGFWLKPTWLWLEPLPDAQDILKLIGGSAYTAYQQRPPRPDL